MLYRPVALRYRAYGFGVLPLRVGEGRGEGNRPRSGKYYACPTYR